MNQFGLHKKEEEGIYTCAETWNAIRRKGMDVGWWKMVWSPIDIPRHAFITWLGVRDSLGTGEGMQKWGYNSIVLCVFCRSCIEGRDHLFFQCGFSKLFW
jgi:hypothetical protein